MAKQSKQDQVAKEVREDSRRSDAGDAPFAAKGTNPDGRGVVGEPVTTTFDERTGVAQPFMTPDGHQDNGQADLDKVDGARGGATREGNTSTVEETEKAIEKGIVEGPQNMAEVGESDEKPKNPVATDEDR